MAECQRCGVETLLRDGCDPTDECDNCAHELVVSLRAEVERLRADCNTLAANYSAQEKRAKAADAENERLRALLLDIDKAWSALDQSDLIVITDEEYRLGHDAPYNAMAGLMLNVRAAVGEG